MPMPSRWLESARNIGRRFGEAEVLVRSQALAYHTLLAIVPTVGLFFWYLSSIGVTEHWLQLSKEFIVHQLNVSSSAAFVENFERLTSTVQGNSWGWVGLVFLFYTVANVIVEFGKSLDVILGTARHQPETNWSFLRITLRRLIVMLGLPIALTLSLVVSQWVRQDSWLHHIFDLRAVGSYFALLIPLAVNVMVFTLIYHLIPRNPVPWREAAKAAVVVAPISDLTRYIFGLYNNYAVSVHKIYGVLAVIPMFILWVQLAWLVILCGALLIRFKPPVVEVAESR